MIKKILSCFFALLLLCAPLTGSLAQEAGIEGAVGTFLAETMTAKGNEATDAWQKFVYGQGASSITMDLEKFDIEAGKSLTVNFLLSSGAPDFKEIGKYEGDPEVFLAAVAKSVATPNTKSKISLTITQEKGAYSVAYAKGAESALEKAVKAAASKGKKAMGGKTMLTALTDYLTPAPVAKGKKTPENLETHQVAFSKYLTRNQSIEGTGLAAAAFYSMKGQKLDVSEGPNALKLTFTMANMSELSNAVYLQQYQNYCYDEKAKQYSDADLGDQFERAVEQQAITYRHSKQADIECEMSADLFDLPKDLDYTDYLPMTDAYVMLLLKSSKIDQIKEDIAQLPDYPAMEFPKTGIVEGKNRGTKIIVTNRNKEAALSLTFTKESNSEVAAVVFIRPSGKATFYLPKGSYSLETQVGFVWYGAEHRFGEYTASRTEDGVKIKDSSYYHTMTYGSK